MPHLSSSLSSSLTFHGSLNAGDRMGQVLTHHLSLHGVPFVNHNPLSLPTGHCVVVSCPGDRSFYTYRGAVESFDPTVSTPSPCHLHLAGFSNFGSLSVDRMVSLFKEVLSSGGTTSLTPQWGETYDSLLPLLPFITYLICSESEAYGISLTSSTSAVSDFFSSPSSPSNTVITTGSGGGYLVTPSSGMHLSFTAPILPSPPVDLTGAGDAFAAGFISVAVGRGGGVEEAVKEGAAWGGACCLVKGAR